MPVVLSLLEVDIGFLRLKAHLRKVTVVSLFLPSRFFILLHTKKQPRDSERGTFIRTYPLVSASRPLRDLLHL